MWLSRPLYLTILVLGILYFMLFTNFTFSTLFRYHSSGWIPFKKSRALCYSEFKVEKLKLWHNACALAFVQEHKEQIPLSYEITLLREEHGGSQPSPSSKAIELANACTLLFALLLEQRATHVHYYLCCHSSMPLLFAIAYDWVT